MRNRDERAATSTRYLTVILLIVVVSVVLVAASPLALGLFGGASNEWERLSFIGQTYGAVSALIAAFALVGIILTLVYQARDTRRAIEETRRQAMSDLLRMAMEDPDLDACWGPVPADEDPRVRKQQLYTNMIISQWSSAFETGALPESRLRAVAAEMFQGEVGYSYWTQAREAPSMTEGTRREQRFVEILDEVYQQTPAPRAQVSQAEAPPQPATPQRRSWRTHALTAAAGAAAGALAAGAAAARRKRPSARPKRGPMRWFTYR
ncbi:putative membrane protein [Lipingzhangella halophila]|uniref:Putative membrane protein n=1 Tax=Lipingzhangella halophila TaxID=1783352 RepID=A0A7W7RDW2_9ACTN|nr:DUF6082 family protein [Lipingzhangella halophila]MBB4930005.1 putative membrane protein [Lipingzhangella halophila]